VGVLFYKAAALFEIGYSAIGKTLHYSKELGQILKKGDHFLKKDGHV